MKKLPINKAYLEKLQKAATHYRAGPARAAKLRQQERKHYAQDLMDNLSKEPLKDLIPNSRQNPKRPPRSLGRFIFYQSFRLFVFLSVWGSILFTCLLVWYALTLPRLDDVLAVKRTPSILILDREGREIKAVGELYGRAISPDHIPKHMKQAILAIEDKRFYHHHGIDPIGLVRAFTTNLVTGSRRQGGSTITQQVAKNIFLSKEKTIKRKIQELMLALWLEHKFTKDQILSLYMNRVYLGSGAYGVAAAARKYYGKTADALSLYEAASIAALLKAPSAYNPLTAPQASAERTRLVLNAMVANHFITREEAVGANPSKAIKAYNPNGKRFFVDWILEQLDSTLGSIDEDIVVETTLDLSLQNQAEYIFLKTLADQGAVSKAHEGAVIVMNKSGGILTMIGGRNYENSQFNRATQALRQPGSSFKPFVFLAALENGYTPQTIVEDTPVTLDNWAPKNHEEKYEGSIPLKRALAKSSNVVTVKLAQAVGIEHIIETARKLGLVDSLTRDFSIALGTSSLKLIDLVMAYGTFANGGMGVWAYGITRIKDKDGHLIYERTGGGPGQLITPAQAKQMDEMLRYVVTDGTGQAAQMPGLSVAGKTGTSQENKDAWFIGYTPSFVGGVWVGNDDGDPMDKVYGGTLPATLWHAVMMKAHNL